MKNQSFEDFIKLIQSKTIFQGTFEWDDPNLNSNDFNNWYLERGKFYECSARRFLSFRFKIERHDPGICFYNGQLMASNNSNLTYCEGMLYSTGNGRAIHHGFAVLENKVIDITLQKNWKEMKRDLITTENSKLRLFYHGIEIPMSFIRTMPSPKGKYPQSSILSAYYHYCKLNGC